MNSLEAVDHALFVFLNGDVGNPLFDVLFPYITDLHKIKWLALGVFPAGLIYWFYRQRKKALVVFLFIGVLIGLGDSTSGKLIKPAIARKRPPDTQVEVVKRTTRFAGFSFPSNHAINMGSSMGFLSMVYPQQRLIFAGVALMVAYSRIYVGVHFPSDVLAGLAMGLFYAFLAFRVYKRVALRLRLNGQRPISEGQA